MHLFTFALWRPARNHNVCPRWRRRWSESPPARRGHVTTRGGDDGVKGFYGGSQGGRSQTESLELNWISGSLREDTSKSVEPRHHFPISWTLFLTWTHFGFFFFFSIYFLIESWTETPSFKNGTASTRIQNSFRCISRRVINYLLLNWGIFVLAPEQPSQLHQNVTLEK